MEWLIAIGIGWWILATIGKSREQDAVREAINQIGPFRARLVDTHLEGHEDGPGVVDLEIRGLMPLTGTYDTTAITTIYDVTDSSDGEPVVSLLDSVQEDGSTIFQHRQEFGQLGPGVGTEDWVLVSRFVPSMLVPPKKGKRKFKVVITFVDSDNSPEISLGFFENNVGILFDKTLNYEYKYENDGWRDGAENKRKARPLVIKLAMAVAMADGSLDDKEGVVINAWIKKQVASFPNQEEEIKTSCNTALKESFGQAKSGNLGLSQTVTEFDKIAQENDKYDAMELCYDVMSADGIADARELKVLRSIGEKLGLDMQRLDALRDKSMLDLGTSFSGEGAEEESLGLKPGWDTDRKLRHLNAEFVKWSNRVSRLKDRSEKENAKRHLDLIAKARRKLQENKDKKKKRHDKEND